MEFCITKSTMAGALVGMETYSYTDEASERQARKQAVRAWSKTLAGLEFDCRAQLVQLTGQARLLIADSALVVRN